MLPKSAKSEKNSIAPPAIQMAVSSFKGVSSSMI